MKKFIGIFLIAAFGAAAGAGVMKWMDKDEYVSFPTQPTVQNVNLKTSTGANVVENPDFISASSLATPAVVHIKSFYSVNKKRSSDPFGGLFGNPYGGIRPQSSGSGVIISKDGYIATNNHVVDDADKVEVVLNDKRSYKALVIGTDPTTDLALLKIEERNLPSLSFGNSSDVQVGEWVLAVGNPFNLTSTVTAGIVSAKGRNLNLLNEEFAIESFIQTDAAVNPGNSGGALINTKGELVGINTAIASETGSYAGYSFAVPVNIVKKVMEDLREFGEVQRGIIGVQIRNINAQFAEEQGLGRLDGAYVSGIIEGGAAESAGLQRGDVISKVNGDDVSSASELQEAIGTFRPGDKVDLEVYRGNKKLDLSVVLRDRNGGTDLANRRTESDLSAPDADNELGAIMEPISVLDKAEYGIDNGVKVSSVRSGKLADVGVEDGFVITRVNKVHVNEPAEVEKLIKNSDGSVLIEGISPEGKRQFFAFDY